MGRVARGAAVTGLGLSAGFLVHKAEGQVVWQIDASKCVNSRLGEVGVKVCDLCVKECVVTQSAVRAVNEYSKCGRCCVCPAYYSVKSAVGRDGLPSEKLCPRDAILRKPIGEADPNDPANNFYEYVIDEAKCDGCGKCVMACKEPAGLSSIILKVRHDLCVNCNNCAISTACPKDALNQWPALKAVLGESAPA
ncbi:MAG: 4Fe-4S binding protein [Candidatus Solibacter usitatus]|nr:4Fe-4S binding protein [Candidatus Solibacter usitatus]